MSTIKLHFPNIQSQILWKLREDFEKGLIDLSLFSTSEHYYENLYLLKQEVLAVWYKVENGEVKICSSNDLRKPQRPDGRPSLGRSPDRLKSLAIWNWSREWEPTSQGNQFIQRTDDYGLTGPKKKTKTGGGLV
jgi:hypothetical protein